MGSSSTCATLSLEPSLEPQGRADSSGGGDTTHDRHRTRGEADESAKPGAWEPRIIAFLCYWCSYTGADNAGTARLKYPANIDIIRVMCSGRIDPDLIMTAFAKGADGVMVCGCHIGDCHYIAGNHKTMARMPMVARVLGDFGIEPERFVHEWVSAAEGDKFARLVRQVTEQVRQAGPLNWPARMRQRGVGHGQDLRSLGRRGMTASIPAAERQPGKLRIGMYWASSCGGCDISLLEIAEHLLELIEVADVVLWPCVADFKYRTVADYPDGHIDVCLFNGGIRSSEQEEIARLLRRKSRTLAAYGACAMDGGIPALANLKSPGEIYDAVYHSNPTLQNPGRTEPVERWSTPQGDLTLPRLYPQVLRLADVVHVDYQIPGCPPVGTQVWKVLQAVVAGEVPARADAVRVGCDNRSVCDECHREKRRVPREGVQAAAPGDPRAQLVPARAGIRVPRRRHPQRLRRAVHEGGNRLPRLLRRLGPGGRPGHGHAQRARLGHRRHDRGPGPRDRGRDRRSDRDVLSLQPGVEHAQGPPVKHARSER